MGIRLTEDERAELDAMARRYGVTVSELVRRIALGQRLEPKVSERETFLYYLSRLIGRLDKLAELAAGEPGGQVDQPEVEELAAKARRVLKAVLDDESWSLGRDSETNVN